MANLEEQYEGEDQKLDIKSLSYEYIVLEGVRETMKLFRDDFHNDIQKENRLIESLNSLEALIDIIKKDPDFEKKKAEVLDNPKEYLRLIIQQLGRGQVLATRRGETI